MGESERKEGETDSGNKRDVGRLKADRKTMGAENEF